MKKLFSAIAVLSVLFTLTFVADANRTVYKNRLMLPHRLESAPRYNDIQTFLATGTWYRSPGVEFVLVIVAAGGGGGGDSDVSLDGGGGAGGVCKTEIVDVRGTSSETVTIGAGGASVTIGGASSFGALVTANGGTAGVKNTSQVSAGLGSGASIINEVSGGNGAYGLGGARSTAHGMGGGGSYGAGGAGGAASTAGGAAAANTGGGGGGGGKGAVRNGGAGGSGICIVISLPREITLP